MKKRGKKHMFENIDKFSLIADNLNVKNKE